MINIARFFQFKKLQIQSLPWLRINNKLNMKFFSTNRPSNYWYKDIEAQNLLTEAGFSIIESNNQGGGLFYILKK